MTRLAGGRDRHRPVPDQRRSLRANSGGSVNTAAYGRAGWVILSAAPDSESPFRRARMRCPDLSWDLGGRDVTEVLVDRELSLLDWLFGLVRGRREPLVVFSS